MIVTMRETVVTVSGRTTVKLNQAVGCYFYNFICPSLRASERNLV